MTAATIHAVETTSCVAEGPRDAECLGAGSATTSNVTHVAGALSLYAIVPAMTNLNTPKTGRGFKIFKNMVMTYESIT